MDVKLTTVVLLSVLLFRSSTSKPLFFNGTSSSLQILGATVPLAQGFKFSFRTCKGGALLSQQGTPGSFFIDVTPGTMNFSTEAFVQSHLVFSWAVQQNVTNTITLGENLDKNLWYTVTFTPGSGNVNSSVSVSDGSRTFSALVSNQILNFAGSGPLFAGDAARGGFTGCIESGTNIVLSTASGSTAKEGCPLDSQPDCPARDCPAGFTGYYCNVNIDDCPSSNCHHFSTCQDGINNYTCICGPRYTGRHCDTFLGSLCGDSPCLNGGVCKDTNDLNNYTCACTPGYTGRNCSIKVTPCSIDPCLNNGLCKVAGSSNETFECDCPTGFRGQRCEQNIDDCANLPCSAGQCIDGVNNYTCNCTGSGYYGQNCELDINECDTLFPCENNATCQNAGGTYQCRCLGGFQGKNCEVNIDECSPGPCKNGGTCQDGINRYTCLCVLGFEGRDCENNIDDCKPDSCNNHSHCEDALNNFTCICLPGYTGADCEVDIDECEVNPCLNGGNCTQGVNSYTCTCQDRHNGTNCQFDVIDDCDPNPCVNNGTCDDGFDAYNCTCQPGFRGKRCELDSCHPSPCKNNATCHKLAGDSYNCTCVPGFSGVNCSTNIDECANISCPGNEVCFDGINNYTCACPLGFTGPNCAVNIDECSSNPCQNGANCTDGINGFNCSCPFGFDGAFCENNIDDCPSHGCHNGTCLDGIGNYTCNCSQGFEGRDCEHDINECLAVHCDNGTCVNTPGSYHCQCSPFSTGQFCEVDIKECTELDKPCNGPNGVCLEKKFTGYECFCRDGFHGRNCEKNIDDCRLANDPCKNGGTCKDLTRDYECVCAEGWKGKNCDQDVDECALGICQNGATCANFDGSYNCSCVPGYTDRNCSTDFDECSSSPCYHNSTCHDLLNDYNCSCAAGYTGKNCSVDIDECLSNPCLNNGTCVDLVNGYNCSCTANYTGIHCEYQVSSCLPVNPCTNNGTCLEGNFNNFTCRCQPGFTGSQCENITTFGLNGTSYMAVDNSEGDFDLSLQFRTTLPSGLLAVGNSDASFVLALGNDLVELRYKESVLSAGKGSGLTNGLWHRVDVQVRADFLSLEIDNSSCGGACFVSQNLAPLVAVKILRVSFGGFSSAIAVGNFTGCIQDVMMRSRVVIPLEPGTELFNTSVGCSRSPVCSPQPCVHGRCVDKWIEYQCECERPWTGDQCNTSFVAGTFGAVSPLNPSARSRRDVGNNASYAKFRTNVAIGPNLELSLFVRTRASDGLIAVLTDVTRTRSLSVALGSGGLVVDVNVDGSRSSIPLNHKINDGLWHFVTLNRSEISVDNKTFQGVLIPSTINLQHTYIGGLDDYSAFPQNTLPSETPFRGCVQDMRLDNKLFEFYPLGSPLDSYELVASAHLGQGCPGQDVCGASPCGRGGVCRDQWDEYRCDCHPRFGGPDCSLYGCALVNSCPESSTCVDVGEHYECVRAATFNGSSSAVGFNMTSNGSVDAELSFDLRTRYTDAVVIEIRDVGDKLIAQIVDGKLSVAYSIGGVTGNVVSGVVVSDGQWHRVQLNSSSSATHLTVDRTLDSTSSGFAALTPLLQRAEVLLSNLSRPLKGCLSAVRLGGLLLPFVDYYNSSINVSHIAPLRPRFNTSFGNLKLGCHGDDTCAPSPCERGACRDIWNEFECSCYEGWAGRLCNLTANMTCAHKPCQENSTCVNVTDVSMATNETQLSQVGVDMFRCDCVAGYYGKVCDQPTDECASQPCQNGGNCTDAHLNYTCACVSGFAGRNCSINIDDCAAHNCTNNATCVDGVNAYTCTCATGYNGTFCAQDIDECANGAVGPCVGNGTLSCNNTVGSYVCGCKSGHFGRHCQFDPTDSCEQLAPCVRGTCSDNSTGYYCNCTRGFSGRNCNIDVRECADRPCLNNGTCVDSHSNVTGSHFAGYNCSCTVDYEGANCESLVTPCAPATNPCQNNGSCVRLSFDSYRCDCTEGFGNVNCSGLTKFCPPGRCNHGTCTPLADGFRCTCNVGYQGNTCDDLINKCDSSPCQNGGTCTPRGSGFECTCAAGWIGQRCQTDDPCKATPCENGGTCSRTDERGNFSCACEPGFTGQRCETPQSTREPEPSSSEMPVGVIVGIVAACLLVLLFVVVLLILIKKRADNGTYNPSKQETDFGRVEMNSMMKPPAPERLI